MRQNFHVVVVVVIVAYNSISHNLFRSKQENQTHKSNLLRSGVLRLIAVLHVLLDVLVCTRQSEEEEEASNELLEEKKNLIVTL